MAQRVHSRQLGGFRTSRLAGNNARTARIARSIGVAVQMKTVRPRFGMVKSAVPPPETAQFSQNSDEQISLLPAPARIG